MILASRNDMGVGAEAPRIGFYDTLVYLSAIVTSMISEQRVSKVKSQRTLGHYY